MWNYLPEIKKVFGVIIKQTDELEQLSKRVNELMCDELIKDCSLHRTHREVTQRYYIYEIHKDDFDHIVEHLHLLQAVISPDMVVMAQSSDDEYRIMFRKK